MQIANPIYDVVFKYLLEDEAVAKLIVGTIIGEEIIKLDFLPQESTLYIDRVGHRSLTVYRLDFSAKIKLPTGDYKQVLIEIQKAKLATDIMRFRRYLGEQYQDEANTYLATIDEKKEITKQKALPIVTIYFLGHSLEQTTAPVIKVARQYYDVTTGEKIRTREEFIESLTHDSYVIQIPHLHPDYQSEVEKLLMIFDQRWITTADKRIMNLNEADYPEPYREITRRLQSAIAAPEVRRTMKAEDEILEELITREREIAKRDKVVAEQQQVINEKDKALSEKDKVLSEQQQALLEAQKMIEELQERLQTNKTNG
jgi:hypothetical protein